MSEARTPILPPDAKNISAAGKILHDGRLIAFPTETVYGLGANATDETAIARIFAAKDRPKFNPLIVHVRDAAQARDIVVFNDLTNQLTEAFWPGALTLVQPRRNERISLLVSAGLETLAVRAPNHPVAQALLADTALPIAAPSANRAGRISPTAAGHVVFSLPGPEDGGPEMILDGGPCRVGLESTVVDLSSGAPTLLRPGGIAAEDIEAVIGPLSAPTDNGNESPKSPGMLERHYAPDLPLRLDATEARPGETLLAFGPDATPEDMNLSPTGDLEEAAANLFSMIRTMDGPPFSGIAVMAVPDHGLGRAINDRLRRAAQADD